MKKIAVIVAGGSGKRMGNRLPKQFILLNNKPVLYYTLHTFLSTYDDLEIILVLAEEFVDMGQEIIDAYFEKDRIKIAIGGQSRFESVKNGLNLIEEEAIIFVHDAARCLVSKELIQNCYTKALETGTAIPAVKCSDSLRTVNQAGGNEALDREKVVLIQTPQVFHSKILLPAFNIDYKEWFTDEASVVEAFGMKVSLIEGEKQNIKITHPLDLIIAEQLLSETQLA
ncbi:MAG TPA: 2-C-methyl-D-erythritol 4-phosphate cytidylyltransferase [Niabella sp.]|nr:2-C-methyl-D-erythritol 4-phosphate cytidylyltransferase [Niabella sp.]HQX21332.1 2-C-methyl-D-erythritol 4-phosphate cytidylyltransferase [Niabella sp.]HQX42453.1 2-C-methyl-D-erythritol 4-phosphate cytidylyltransferase [Niabella sp.]HRB08106.1 2-C-methyl-D-erythritol 4-phosphate cytidylyltransferase [Niabella sp.]HRB26911.1 2-C-methyl-D-erythritol 4-phosphate cytidylyltransferase [Niabella sp.]